jgi:hypothetical protein
MSAPPLISKTTNKPSFAFQMLILFSYWVSLGDLDNGQTQQLDAAM